MVCINNTYTDPYFNIAAEKYLLKDRDEDIFMMWQNEASVIIGKHQQAETEVDMDFAHANKIKIARRISGGGAVYHDMGNVNLTFIERNSTFDFGKYTQMMINFLTTIGIEAQEDARLGLGIDGLKISGSAQYIYKKTVLFHATLLFSSNLIMLQNVLNSKSVAYNKQVKSIKSSVTNICEHLPVPMEIDDFKQLIISHFSGDAYTLNDKDISEIKQLKKEQL